LRLVDLKAVCDLGHAAGAQIIVDNVFATPLLQRPLELGADIVVYSATKHIDGQGRCLGGVVLGDAKYIDAVHTFLKNTGPSMSPFNAWVLLKGLETLPVRVARQTETAATIADTIARQR
jgi:O-succinylhomoserine sulfhydrylase